MCITGMWNMNIPSVLLLDILSRLSLKVNIQASAVCKTWCGAAVSVRKLQPPHPWVFYPLRAAEEGNYLLFDPSRSQTYKLNFPELKNYGFSYSRDGWLLVVTKAPSRLIFLFNPFTRDHIYLPKLLLPTTAGDCCSAAPTSSANCLVISFNYTISPPDIVIDTWRPGETIYMDHTSINSQLPGRRAWNNCDFSNGMFYCFSTCGYLGVFDPSPNRETWKILPVKPCLAFRQVDLTRRMMITEHEGDIFVVCNSCYKPIRSRRCLN
uniref:F-box domain-containing protein n=2 Tax=Brassica TaxID=3705 RepID=A0A0D3BPW4_BRAOL